jgi:Domain of unknown function (DUF4375)
LGAEYDPEAEDFRSLHQRAINPAWKSVSIYDGPDVFLAQFSQLRPEIGHLFAAVWCQSEVLNGGFQQFFANSTGVLAPEALKGFRALGLVEWADLLEEAMGLFGEPYPRVRDKRTSVLSSLVNGERNALNPFRKLDDGFIKWTKVERGRFARIADEYAKAITS